MSINEIEGFCPICDSDTIFSVEGPWFRDQLLCNSCGSIPRERALATILSRTIPNYKTKHIHESSPADRGISKKLNTVCRKYIASQYFLKSNERKIGQVFNVNLEDQFFDNETFDIFICLDVMEHVFNPERVIKEIYRTLKPGGYGFMTFPIIKSQVNSLEFRVTVDGDQIKPLKELVFHGNPIDDKGSVVTVDYGYDIHQKIAEWAPFDVEVIRFNRIDIGVIGEFTEVIVLKKGNKMSRKLPLYSP